MSSQETSAAINSLEQIISDMDFESMFPTPPPLLEPMSITPPMTSDPLPQPMSTEPLPTTSGQETKKRNAPIEIHDDSDVQVKVAKKSSSKTSHKKNKTPLLQQALASAHTKRIQLLSSISIPPQPLYNEDSKRDLLLREFEASRRRLQEFDDMRKAFKEKKDILASIDEGIGSGPNSYEHRIREKEIQYKHFGDEMKKLGEEIKKLKACQVSNFTRRKKILAEYKSLEDQMQNF